MPRQACQIPQFPSHTFDSDPHRVMAEAHAQCGPVFKMVIDGTETVVVATSAALRELFKVERGRLEVLNTPLVHDLFGRAVFNLTGDPHAEARLRLRAAFSHRVLPSYVQALVRVTEPAASSWTARPAVDLYAAARDVTLAMSAQLLLGIGTDEMDAYGLRSDFEGFVAATAAPAGPRRYLTARYWAGLRARRRLRVLFDRQARTASERGCEGALPGLAEAFAAAPTPLGPLADHLLALLIAARETTASLITWSLIELAGNPRHARLAAVEARAAVALPGLLVEADALSVLRAVIAETQRLHSPNLLSMRRAIAPLTLCGLEIPAGTRVAYSTSAGHLDADAFPQPDAFRPDRFLSGSARSASLWAFGGGTHACLGRPLAELMTMSTLVSVLARGLPKLLDGPPTRIRYRPAKAPIGQVPFAVDAGILR